MEAEHPGIAETILGVWDDGLVKAESQDPAHAAALTDETVNPTPVSLKQQRAEALPNCSRKNIEIFSDKFLEFASVLETVVAGANAALNSTIPKGLMSLHPIEIFKLTFAGPSFL